MLVSANKSYRDQCTSQSLGTHLADPVQNEFSPDLGPFFRRDLFVPHQLTSCLHEPVVYPISYQLHVALLS